MGLSYNLIFIDNKSKNISQESLLKNIKSKKVLELENTNFGTIFKKIHVPGESKWGLSILENLIIIADENNVINEVVLKCYLEKHIILKLECADTAGITTMSYWENGNLIRKYSEGNNEYLEMYKEMKDEIPEDVYEEMIKGDEDLGDEQWFEKNGKDHDQIIDLYLREYDSKENNIHSLKWKLYGE